jgi:hypothetical protein
MSLQNLKKIITEKNPDPNLISKKDFPKSQKKLAAAAVTRAELPEVPDDQKPSVDKLRRVARLEPAVRKIVSRAAALADLITEQDLEDDARVIREATNATTLAYDPHLQKHVERPDHKTRLAATTLRRAYHEGLPVKREISVNGTFESFETVLDRLKQSPEAQRMLAGMGMNLGVQKSPVEIEAEFTRETPTEE